MASPQLSVIGTAGHFTQGLAHFQVNWQTAMSDMWTHTCLLQKHVDPPGMAEAMLAGAGVKRLRSDMRMPGAPSSLWCVTNSNMMIAPS